MWDYFPTDELLVFDRTVDGAEQTAAVDVWQTDPRMQGGASEGHRVAVVSIEVLERMLGELGFVRRAGL